jgi:protein SCO1/2
MAKGKRQVLFVFLIIAFPFLIAVFLRFCAQHEFVSLPRMYSISGTGDTLFHTLPDFSLTDQNAKPFTRDMMRGKIYLVNFFSTQGDTLVNLVMDGHLKDVYQNADKVENIRFLSIAIDPEIDSLEVIRKQAIKWEGQSPKWTVALPPSMEEAVRIGRELGLPEFKNTDPSFKPFAVQTVAFIDRKGDVRGFYTLSDLGEVKRIKEDMYALIRLDYDGDFGE